MQSYSLEIDEYSDDNYYLIGIHSVLEDYRMAFLLNKFFKFNFKKASYSLDVKNENFNSFYSIFEYTNKELALDWFLINNSYKAVAKSTNSGLFNESEIITHLLPEKKRIDYFLKIEGDADSEYIEESIKKINTISQVLTSYEIQTNTLKSKNFLIF